MTDAGGHSPFSQILLDRHAGERLRGVLTVSLLVGPVVSAIDVWQTWCGARHVPSILVRVSEPADAARELIRQLESRYDWRAISLRRLRSSAGISSDAPSLLPTQAELAPLLPPGSASSASLELAAAIIRGAGVGAGVLPAFTEPIELLQAMAGLLDPVEAPGVLIAPLDSFGTDIGSGAAWLGEIAAVAWRICHAAPGWAVAVTSAADAVENYRSTAASSRERSFLLGGAVLLSPDPDPLIGVAANVGAAEESDPPPLPEPMRQLVSRLAGEPAPRSLRAAHATAAALRPQRDDAARSAAERLLFELLQLHPTTRGLFALNVPADFQFGSRPAEIDLLATSLRLAAEVDGYFHFTEPDRYRRDRRKDLLLQQHGYTICRVLADDVLDRPEEVLDIIVAAVDHAVRRNPGGSR